ncbi:hypothetical protein COU80_00425 [Candidatus Peregrinibacteria bacterium CG10_big_fil_rev_8_21_14_0_10_55_24]|nr:MAG: hypothetical protein COU80_00425 [Candidatus Peregrinibacteria bacterium CG10_big_fil_rev_8_21_14_0_10_55_24]
MPYPENFGRNGDISECSQELRLNGERRTITAFNTTQSVGSVREAVSALGDAFHLRLLTHLGMGVRHVAICHPVGREDDVRGVMERLQGRETASIVGCPNLCRAEGSAGEVPLQEEALYP